jgi:hypothetical protein
MKAVVTKLVMMTIVSAMTVMVVAIGIMAAEDMLPVD